MQVYIQSLSFRAQRRIPIQTETEIPRFTRNDNMHGFTLVELAIALMVIGLLIGGVLKGQELIENARVIRIGRDYNDIKTATVIFKSIYNALPGDIKNPSRVLTDCNSSPCSSAGNQDNLIGEAGEAYAKEHLLPSVPHIIQLSRNTEYTRFWIHLEKAQLISNLQKTNDYVPDAAISPLVYIVNYYDDIRAGWGDALPQAQNFFVLMGIQSTSISPTLYPVLPSAFAEKIDRKFDDGKPFTGSIRALGGYNATVNSSCARTSDNTYARNKQPWCNLGMSMD